MNVSVVAFIGHAIFWAVLVPHVNGPFDLFKWIRSYGKPFNCSLCMAFWSTIWAFIISEVGLRYSSEYILFTGIIGFAWFVIQLMGFLNTDE